MSLQFSEKLKRMPQYPEANAYGKKDDLTMLASNESPYLPPESVIQVASQALLTINRYPDPHFEQLRQQISSWLGVSPNKITVGNGADELLIGTAEVMLNQADEIIYMWPSFSMYPHLTAITGAMEQKVPLTSNYLADLDAMANAVTDKTRLIIICNPNNPTSTAIKISSVEAFIDRLPKNICVLIDEAYGEFNRLDDPNASIPLLEKFNNVVLVRTFAKVFGLCGLRIGYALAGSEELITNLNRIRAPFTVNTIALAAATEAVKRAEELWETIELTIKSRSELIAGLRELGFSPLESQTNFCLVDLADRIDESKALAGLLDQGVLVRAGTPLGCPNSLRVTCGTPEENKKFLTALANLL